MGLTDIDRNGIQGAELVFNGELEGEEGKFIGIKSAANNNRWRKNRYQAWK